MSFVLNCTNTNIKICVWEPVYCRLSEKSLGTTGANSHSAMKTTWVALSSPPSLFH